jgi:hypothetical protein
LGKRPARSEQENIEVSGEPPPRTAAKKFTKQYFGGKYDDCV